MEASLLFLLYFSVVLFLGGVMITGWYAITRGEWEYNADSTPYWSGKLFSPWLRFWTQEKGKERVYYRGQELENMVMKITNLLGIKDYRFDEHKTHLIVNDAVDDLFFRKKHYLFHHLKVTVSKKEIRSNEHLIFLFSEDPIYKFPHFLRAPLATCIYCHGSIYGSIIWWLSAVIFKNFFSLPFRWEVLAAFWVPFIISEAFVAPYLNKKL